MKPENPHRVCKPTCIDRLYLQKIEEAARTQGSGLREIGPEGVVDRIAGTVQVIDGAVAIHPGSARTTCTTCHRLLHHPTSPSGRNALVCSKCRGGNRAAAIVLPFVFTKGADLKAGRP